WNRDIPVPPRRPPARFCTDAADGPAPSVLPDDPAVYELSVRRASGAVERIEVDSALYDGADREAAADPETWYAEVVGITVAGRHHRESPSASGRLLWDLLLAWSGLGLLLWAVFGGGRAITFFGIMGHRAFAWVWFGVWTLWPVTGLLTGRGASWLALPLSAVFWLFGAVIAVAFFRNDGFRLRAHRLRAHRLRAHRLRARRLRAHRLR
ncbi:hypothetical protein, partial [Kitasatospora sp. NPDC005748]|uniref:hypothetical protein n=1 Tax=Kitasatospora sp. NPDC005748 TaxID=3157063 RepID=UPI0033CE2C43